MKQPSHLVRTLLLTLFLSIACNLPQWGDTGGMGGQVGAFRMDSVEIGLVTCSPHEEIYSLYGHTALRYHDHASGEDLVFNWGVFHAEDNNFVWRFTMGQTDYELGVAPTHAFCKYYKEWGSQVTEQVLRLTAEEKLHIAQALGINLRPENRVFRYNVFYDNCATRPRDIIVRNLQGTIHYSPATAKNLPQLGEAGGGFSQWGEAGGGFPSFRSMVRTCTAGHPWTTFGNDILLGARADMPTTQHEQQFLPANLRHDFDRATVTRKGSSEPLVSERRELVPPGVQVVEPGFPLTPFACAMLLLAVTLSVSLFEWTRKTATRWFDLLLMSVTGLAGCILTLMLFSEHPTTSTNLQVLLLNPLPLLFLWPVIRGRKTHFFTIWLVLALLFLVGGLWQSYAEGMYVVAASILLRAIMHKFISPLTIGKLPQDGGRKEGFHH